MIDGAIGFHDAYNRGELVAPPDDYLDMILIPALLNTPWATFREYPFAAQAAIRRLVLIWIAGGQGMNPETIRSG